MITKRYYSSNFNSYNFDDDNFIELGTIGQGSSSLVCLNYKIDGEELIVIKKPFKNNETSKLFKRELKNFKSSQHPLMSDL